MRDMKLKNSVKPESCKCQQAEKYYKNGQLACFCGAVQMSVSSLSKCPKKLF